MLKQVLKNTQTNGNWDKIYDNITNKIVDFEIYISEVKHYVVKEDICIKLQEYIQKMKFDKKVYLQFDVVPLMDYLEYLNINDLINKVQYNDMSYMAIVLETGSKILKQSKQQLAS